MTKEQYNQEIECSFQSAIIGAYYGNDMESAAEEGRICGVPVESEMEVNVVFDLGMSDSTVIWAYQLIGKDPRPVGKARCWHTDFHLQHRLLFLL